MRRAIIKLTDACQMKCIYCINSDDASKQDTISIETVKEILAKFKPHEVEFTGGEPGCRFSLLIDAVREAKKTTGFVMVNSNLELLFPKRIRQLEKGGLSHLHCAIHTLDHKMHKLIRGNPNATLNKALSNLEYIFQNTNLKIIFEFVPMRINLKEYPKVYRYVLEQKKKYKDKVVDLEIGRLIPKGRASSELAPPVEEQVKILQSVGKPEITVEVFCFGKKTSQKLSDTGYLINPCDAGRGMFYFDIKGRVLSDNFSAFVITENYRNFDIRKKPRFFCPYRGSPDNFPLKGKSS